MLRYLFFLWLIIYAPLPAAEELSMRDLLNLPFGQLYNMSVKSEPNRSAGATNESIIKLRKPALQRKAKKSFVILSDPESAYHPDTRSAGARQVKRELQKEHYFDFFHSNPDLQCIASPKGFFKEVNFAFTEVLGYSRDELLEKSFTEFVVPEDRQSTLDEIRKLENGLLTIDFENRYLCKDGSICWLSWRAAANPANNLIYATARNVSEFKKYEEKLQLAEMVYLNTIEAVVITDADNRILAVNPAFTEITGYAPAEVVGKNPSIFKSGRHSPEFYQAMWQELNNKGHWQGEIWDKRKSGDHYAKILNINTIFNKEGRVHRYLALFSDVSASKHYEQIAELNKAKLEAEEANRIKSDFLSSMSHELRTPMNAVLGFAQLLATDDLTEEQFDHTQEILAAGHHLLDLINQVLDLSKIESGNLELMLEKIDLAVLVRNCQALVLPLTQKNGITIVNNVKTLNYFTVLADSLRLKQVLLNLISNAIKYNREGGSITFSCERINPQMIRLNVIDTGAGLSDIQLSKLFLPFERLNAKNSSIEGTGIGLCISKTLIEAMNGTIGADSTVGVGSCFWIEIPLA